MPDRRALAAFILTASIVGAAAQDKTAPMSTETEQRSGTPILLSAEQERLVWQLINNHPIASPPHPLLIVQVGEVMPKDVTLQAIPDDVAAEVTLLKGYDYAILQDRLLIVSRANKTVTYLIDGTLRRNY